MVGSRPELVFLFDEPGPKHSAFVVPAAAAAPSRRSRIRQRGSSCSLQRSRAAAAGPPPFSSRHRVRPPLSMATSCKSEIIPDGSVAAGGRLRVAPVPVSPGGGRGLGVSNGISRSRGSGVNTSRNRMMAAAKRRRWTEVRRTVTDRGKRV